MTHLNSRNQAEREKWEKSHDSLVKSIESRHKDQLEQCKAELARVHEDLQERER